jgi:polyhydroxybutyrate depolymerase
VAPLTVQLTRSDGGVCFESVFDASTVRRNDTGRMRARGTVKATTPMPPLSSLGCGTALAAYAPGMSTADTLVHDGLTRSFRVYLPPSYDASGSTPTPVFLLLHGGFGSGAQIEASSRLLEVADANGFIVVSPDGVAGPGGVRTWNGGGCCGFAVSSGVDDVGFIGAVLDRLEGNLCVDRRRVYAAGMSNGAILSHRLACDLAGRIRAVGSVSGAMMADPCTPARPVPVMEIHGEEDLNIPYTGGMGCGAAGVPFPSVSDTLAAWVARDGCHGLVSTLPPQGDGICELPGTCTAGTDVELCTIPNGGHQWPGGTPPLIGGLPGCDFGYQSQTFSASQVLWEFFRQHPPG